MELHLQRQDCLGYPDRDIHPPAFGWGIDLIFIGIDP
jgi:hypothetical protein